MALTDNGIMAEGLAVDFEFMFQEAVGDEGPEIEVVVDTPPPSVVVEAEPSPEPSLVASAFTMPDDWELPPSPQVVEVKEYLGGGFYRTSQRRPLYYSGGWLVVGRTYLVRCGLTPAGITGGPKGGRFYYGEDATLTDEIPLKRRRKGKRGPAIREVSGTVRNMVHIRGSFGYRIYLRERDPFLFVREDQILGRVPQLGETVSVPAVRPPSHPQVGWLQVRWALRPGRPEHLLSWLRQFVRGPLGAAGERTGGVV